jgi:hypothetical protein
VPGKGRPFQRGISANPGGQPKAAKDVREMARELGPAAIRALQRGLNDPDKYHYCATALLDRGFGKPRQEFDATIRTLDGGIDAPPRDETWEQWSARRARQLREELRSNGADDGGETKH